MSYDDPASLVKHETLADLVVAYRLGQVTAPLMIDNDSTSVYQESAPGADDWGCVFEMDPGVLLEQALDLLGVPHEHV